MKIKNIIRNIYSINYENILLDNNDEFITEDNGISDFAQYMRKNDPDNGILVTFSNYKNGLFYSTKNNGQLYADPSVLPENVTFTMNIVGLKKGYWYKITVSARNAGSNVSITKNRDLIVTNSNEEAIIKEDLTNTSSNEDYTGYFLGNSTEDYLFFNLGKIVIKDIKIDEVEIKNSEEHIESNILGEGVRSLVSYGIFKMSIPNNGYTGRYIKLKRLGGYGLELYYDSKNISYILERSNTENIMKESFVLPKYSIEINDTKLLKYNYYRSICTKDINSGLSPNTMKTGYMEFCILNENTRNMKYDKSGNIYVYIYENK